jgi:hypothetical protein
MSELTAGPLVENNFFIAPDPAAFAGRALDAQEVALVGSWCGSTTRTAQHSFELSFLRCDPTLIG